ncbi:asparagine synthase (glutamine-hydrolyzing) [Marinobacter adhaerens]|uniref:asparagine synthase (glutamine-hydrolyzing) n=1 Tax=Marinobacter adhaerens TaxID=1033846 RepID=UPI001C567EFD|nr:asparagine synthase (glutamine-hydrolyzing) [Marinobacter adhaerens]MBW3226013.1 asparagine synthase (glutamine-hydrolyzing) [Marinobacter adhaerens]
MCGFGGFWAIAGETRDFDNTLRKMAKSIIHRGPDDSGDWHDARTGIGLAHTRLSIVDLSAAGHQPMHSACDRYVIAFNGEIYNHVALRQQLEEAHGVSQWRGHSDTETLLACFAAWGIEQTLQATVGMFALALWDKHDHVLTLARDRLGEKPLYWGWCNQTLLFGSELKALKVHPAFNTEVNRSALALLMRYNTIPSPYSIYRGIQKLPAGHMVQIRQGDGAGEAIPKAYWALNEVVESCLANPFIGSDNEAVAALEQRICQSVSDQMLADVPLGAFLSGGVDSSTVVALMQQQSSKPVRTFAIGFDEPGYNEAQYAKEVAEHLDTDHTELYVGTEDALAVIPDLPTIYCEPFADSSQIPTFLVCKMAKQQVTVALSGDGGDELFGGYNPYQFAPKVWRAIRRLPLPLRKLAVSVLADAPVPDKLHKLLRVLPSENREAFYDALMSHWQQPEEAVIGAQSLPTIINNPSHWPKTDTFEHWMMAVDTKQYMSDDILVKVDRAAMANSLETRVPLLDHRVVEFAWQLPMHQKIRNGTGKWALREVLHRHVPREMIERPKKGFSIPLAQWLRGPLRDWAEALLEETRLRREGYFHAAPIRKLWSEHQDGKRDNALKLWSVLMFQAWLEHQYD